MEFDVKFFEQLAALFVTIMTSILIPALGWVWLRIVIDLLGQSYLWATPKTALAISPPNLSLAVPNLRTTEPDTL